MDDYHARLPPPVAPLVKLARCEACGSETTIPADTDRVETVTICPEGGMCVLVVPNPGVVLGRLA